MKTYWWSSKINHVYYVCTTCVLDVHYVRTTCVLRVYVELHNLNRSIQCCIFTIWSLLILLLPVASIRRKLLKTTITEERRVHTSSERCNFQHGSSTNQFNFKQIIQILHPIVIDYLSPHLYIVYMYAERIKRLITKNDLGNVTTN